mgnify:CR=1 FL=1
MRTYKNRKNCRKPKSYKKRKPKRGGAIEYVYKYVDGKRVKVRVNTKKKRSTK